jgi:hypothetical protein
MWEIEKVAGLNPNNFEILEKHPVYIVTHKPSGESYKIDYNAVAFLTAVHGVDGNQEAANLVCLNFMEIISRLCAKYESLYKFILQIDSSSQEAQSIKQEMNELWNKIDDSRHGYLKGKCDAILKDYTE